MNKFQDLKKTYPYLLKEYESHGLQKITESKKLFFKIFWTIFFVVSSASSIYFMNESVKSYLKYEVIQKTETVFLNQITFPTITMCSDIFIDESIKNYIDTCSFNLNDDCKINPDNYFKMFRSYSTGRNCFQFNGDKNMSTNSIPIQNSTLPEKLNGFILNFTTSSIISNSTTITSTSSIANSSTSSATTKSNTTTTSSTSSITNSSTSSTNSNTTTPVTNNSSFTNNPILTFIEPTKSSKSQSIDIYIDDPSLPSFINQIDYKIPDFSLNPNYEYDITLTKTITEHLEIPYNPCYKNAYNNFPLNKTIINFF
jgi:hypothetical protein